MKQELVNYWMTRNVITTTTDTNLHEAHRLMTENQIRRLPIVGRGRLVGIVTLGDIRGADASDATTLSIWELHYLISKVRMKDVMTHNPIIISPKATIADAAEKMLESKISGLPVVDDDHRLVGIITESDIFRLVVQAWKKTPVMEMALPDMV
ncbi:MAG: CBS domain-containing protein [Chloroflexi bacterium]|nr:CBS domain-containing protein [Chloroflexota bacterium]